MKLWTDSLSRKPWVVLHEARRFRWGGDLRRHYIFEALGKRPRAHLVHGWSADAIANAVPEADNSPSQRPLLASVELLDDDALGMAKERARCAVLDVHDDAVLQTAALGIELGTERRAELVRMSEANTDAFEVLVAPSESFAELAGLDPARTVIAPNGTDPRVITPGPWPSTPRITMASGAAPKRGIELLIEATGILRPRHPDLSLDLLLAATGPASQTYLDALRADTASEPWISFASSSYQEFGALLSRATTIAIPNPPNAYWEGIVPIKLVDALAAGRPVVVTPRRELRRLVERTGTGVVAADDTAEALADALERVISDDASARRLGAAARRVAEREFDWAVISARLARTLVRRRW